MVSYAVAWVLERTTGNRECLTILLKTKARNLIIKQYSSDGEVTGRYPEKRRLVP